MKEGDHMINGELEVDNFAGGVGATTSIMMIPLLLQVEIHH